MCSVNLPVHVELGMFRVLTKRVSFPVLIFLLPVLRFLVPVPMHLRDLSVYILWFLIKLLYVYVYLPGIPFYLHL